MLQSQPARKQRISAFVSVRAAALADKRRVVSALRAAWQKVLAASAIAMATALAGGIAIAGDSTDPAKLSNLVRQDCGSCHGLTLRGGLGKPLTADRLMQWDGDQLMQIILDGVPGTPMPPWRGLLTEAEVRWIVEALKSGRLQ